jgi:hypothetical protein
MWSVVGFEPATTGHVGHQCDEVTPRLLQQLSQPTLPLPVGRLSSQPRLHTAVVGDPRHRFRSYSVVCHACRTT